MKSIILIGRSGCGKTTLTQALKGEQIRYQKTQCVDYFDTVIDTPGEYVQMRSMGSALAVYSYEADVVGLLISAVEPYSLFPPNITCMANREVIGIVTKVDLDGADWRRAQRWLQLAGCKKIFLVNAKKRQGILEILDYLSNDRK